MAAPKPTKPRKRPTSTSRTTPAATSTSTSSDEPRFFATPAKWRAWLEKNHASVGELWVGFHKRETGTPSITWPQSVDEALCFGWIDGLRKSVDARAYKIRFTPRKATSVWSNINVRRVGELEREGRMRPAGLAVFALRDEKRTGVASFEREQPAELEPPMQRRLDENQAASTYFGARPPWYRRSALHWVMSAKREETRHKRLEILIECSAIGVHVPPLRRPGGAA